MASDEGETMEQEEERITVCVFKDYEVMPKCQWRHEINDTPMCWRNCAGCIYVKAIKEKERDPP
jgi:hypothetical protein